MDKLAGNGKWDGIVQVLVATALIGLIWVSILVLAALEPVRD